MLDNPYLELKFILDSYEIEVKQVTVETLKGKKAVFWVETNKGKFILKKMPVDKRRLFFLLSAIVHLRAGGVNIPQIYTTKKGDLFVEDGEKVYILMEAIKGKSPSYNVASELANIMQSMAMFHRVSKGYLPQAEVKIRSHLGIWEKHYSQLVTDLIKFKVRSLQNNQRPFEEFYLAHCDYFIEEGKTCLASLKENAYINWVAKVEQETNLCHQDFAAGNLGLVDGKLFIYDLDSLTIDLPARDLRKIINKVMKKGQWDTKLALRMLSSYHQTNPLTSSEYSVLFIDLRFPHLFFGAVSKYFDNREGEWTLQKHLSRLKAITKTEKDKVKVLKNQEEIINSIISKAALKEGGK